MRKNGRLWLSLALIVVGGMFYLLFRPRTLLLFAAADALGLGHAVDYLRSMVTEVHLPDFVAYCLPNGLWALAYVTLIDWVMKAYDKRTRLLFASFIPLLGAVSELVQYAGWIPGTYDMGDLLCYLLPWIGYAVGTRHSTSQQSEDISTTNNY